MPYAYHPAQHFQVYFPSPAKQAPLSLSHLGGFQALANGVRGEFLYSQKVHASISLKANSVSVQTVQSLQPLLAAPHVHGLTFTAWLLNLTIAPERWNHCLTSPATLWLRRHQFLHPLVFTKITSSISIAMKPRSGGGYYWPGLAKNKPSLYWASNTTNVLNTTTHFPEVPK